MPKKSVVFRNKRREALAAKSKSIRDALRKAVSNTELSDEEREEASLKMQKLPRNGSPTRTRNRCNMCGRPRAFNRLTGLCRLHMRLAVLKGMVPGMRKASW